jgi:hypothetical protein
MLLAARRARRGIGSGNPARHTPSKPDQAHPWPDPVPDLWEEASAGGHAQLFEQQNSGGVKDPRRAVEKMRLDLLHKSVKIATEHTETFENKLLKLIFSVISVARKSFARGLLPFWQNTLNDLKDTPKTCPCL